MTETDNDIMMTGVNQILGITPFPNKEIEAPCKHEDDGYDYSEDINSRKIVLRCDKCGEFYEEPRD